jgi:hypothetical protein
VFEFVKPRLKRQPALRRTAPPRENLGKDIGYPLSYVIKIITRGLCDLLSS